MVESRAQRRNRIGRDSGVDFRRTGLTARRVDAAESEPDDEPSLSVPSPRPRRVWPAFFLVTVVLIALTIAGPSFFDREDDPRPIVETTLETSGLGKILSGGRKWRDLPFTLDADAREDLAICLRLAGEVQETTNGVSAFTAQGVRSELEAVLARRPKFFYAESLLAHWHSLRGDAARSREYQARALEHAPVVLIQRYELGDGGPLAGARIETFQVECNRVKNGALNPSLKLTFFDLTTDADGAIRVPVYDTVYRLFNTSHPEGHSAVYPRLGWFESPSRVGLLPPARVRPER